jgi:hypothetical protein
MPKGDLPCAPWSYRDWSCLGSYWTLTTAYIEALRHYNLRESSCCHQYCWPNDGMHPVLWKLSIPRLPPQCRTGKWLYPFQLVRLLRNGIPILVLKMKSKSAGTTQSLLLSIHDKTPNEVTTDPNIQEAKVLTLIYTLLLRVHILHVSSSWANNFVIILSRYTY